MRSSYCMEHTITFFEIVLETQIVNPIKPIKMGKTETPAGTDQQTGGEANEAAIQNDQNANQNNQVAIKRVELPAMPEQITCVVVGDTEISEPEEQRQAVVTFLRSKLLRQFGVTSLNNVAVSTTPVGFNKQNVQTRLKLPKVKTTPAGVFAESFQEYVTRCIPEINKWMNDSIINGVQFTQELVEEMVK